MEKLNKQMDDALNTKVAALNATDDETGDGKVDALDLKHQLDRVEAQLELQDQQNRALLRSQKRLLWAAIAIVVVLCLIMGGLLLRFNTAYNQVITTCAQVNEIAGTLQDSLAKLDTEQLDSMMQTLPDIADKLSQIDVDALNDVMAKLPATMDAVAQLQQQLNSVASFLGNVGSIFGVSGSPAVFEKAVIHNAKCACASFPVREQHMRFLLQFYGRMSADNFDLFHHDRGAGAYRSSQWQLRRFHPQRPCR